MTLLFVRTKQHFKGVGYTGLQKAQIRGQTIRIQYILIVKLNSWKA